MAFRQLLVSLLASQPTTHSDFDLAVSHCAWVCWTHACKPTLAAGMGTAFVPAAAAAWCHSADTRKVVHAASCEALVGAFLHCCVPCMSFHTPDVMLMSETESANDTEAKPRLHCPMSAQLFFQAVLRLEISKVSKSGDMVASKPRTLP